MDISKLSNDEAFTDIITKLNNYLENINSYVTGKEQTNPDELSQLRKSWFYDSWVNRFKALRAFDQGREGVIQLPNTTFEEWLYWFQQWSKEYQDDYNQFKQLTFEAILLFEKHMELIDDNVIDQNTKLNNMQQTVNDTNANAKQVKQDSEAAIKQMTELATDAKYHDHVFHYDLMSDFKAAAGLKAGDVALVTGSDSRNNGHSSIFLVREKASNDKYDSDWLVEITGTNLVGEDITGVVTIDNLEDILYGFQITICHGQGDYPQPDVVYYEDAIGTELEGFAMAKSGLGETGVTRPEMIIKYPNSNTMTICIPRNFWMAGKIYYRNRVWWINYQNRSIQIDIGAHDSDKAGRNISKCSAKMVLERTSYFNVPISIPEALVKEEGN